MGFNLKPGVTRATATESLIDFAFGELKCHHIELMDRQMTPQDYQHLGFETLMFGSHELDLRPSLEQIFAGMSQNARNEIRRAQKEGITVEEAHDVKFADDYYEQLKHVFAVKNSVPPFKVDRIRQLIKFMEPTGNLLMLRALNGEGTCVATGIDVGFNETVFGWGRASWRHHSRFRPNELLYWHSIRFWKAKGACLYDLTGEGANKRKFGSNKILVPWIRKSRWRSLALIRSVAQDMFWWAQYAAGKAAHVLEGLKRRTTTTF